MFVRFRAAGRRLQASLIETRRIAGKVRHEHIASLGAITAEPSIADRVAFWQGLHQRLERLANRLDASAQAKLLGEVHARIPMVTVEEMRSLQLENAEADEHFWHGFAEMEAERATGNEELAASAQRTATEAKAQAEQANKRAEAAKDRVERLKRGEAVAGGLGKPVDIDQVMREAGITAATLKRIRQMHTIVELGGEAGFEALVNEIDKRQRSAETAARRTVLRRLVIQGLREGRITR
jgi:hypothetical protein